VPANIVEGCARRHVRETLNFLNIASASLSELAYGLHAANRLGYIDEPTYRALDDQARAVAGPLNGLLKHYRERAGVTRTERPAVSTRTNR
jgi:four helix bundle protein